MSDDDQMNDTKPNGAGDEGQPVDELEKLKAEVAELKDRNLRLFAEFENMRKRNERERQELIRYAHEEVIVELLGFYEDFERCVEAARKNPGDHSGLLKGVEMTLKRMKELFKKYDVRPIDAVGKKFDPRLHEALMTADSNEHEDQTVLEVFQKGYMLGDRVVRTAKVKVSKKPDETDQTLDV
jgi:molecular chaperone GrpE